MKTTVQVLYSISDIKFRLTCNIDKETLFITLATPTFSYEKYITDRFDVETQQDLWQELDRIFGKYRAKYYLLKQTMMDILYLICTFDNAYNVVNNYLISNRLPSFVKVCADYDDCLLF